VIDEDDKMEFLCAESNSTMTLYYYMESGGSTDCSSSMATIYYPFGSSSKKGKAN
jgi:hypothetical protein